MNNDEVMEKYGISKKLGIGIMLQMLLMISALILTIVGIINNTNLHRAIIYIGQAAACILIIVLVAERMEKGSSEKISLGMVILEIVLYIVFQVGFPGVMLGHLNRFLPLVGVLIAGSIAILQKGKNSQLGKE